MHCKHVFMILALTSMQQATAQLSSYAYARSVKPVDSTAYYTVHLNSDVLYKAGLPSIVRLYELKGKDTLEVPYLIAHKIDLSVQPAMKQLRVINDSYVKGKSSYYTFVLDTALIYSSLHIDFTEENYDKDISLEGSDDNKTWKTIIEKDKVFRYWRTADDNFTRNTIYFPEQNYKYLRLALNDEHTAKVRLAAGNVSVPYGRRGESYADELVPFTLTRTEDKGRKKTVLECTFKRDYLVTGIKFRISHSDAFYKRSLQVFQNTLNLRRQPQWVLFQDDYLVSESYNYITCSNYNEAGGFLRTAKIKIEIDNRDDQPLKEIGLDIYTNTETIKVKLEKGANYKLAYGKNKDTAPDYDISYFESKIPRHLKEAALGDETPLAKAKPAAPAAEPFFKSNAWIWLLMAVSIVLVGGFAVSLLKQSKAEKTE